ncbi:unnamed protein product [Phytophthora lilii]|uniref:Unnamed protein product n=1 Tax=Phytophthora lilii TaxID=2077276 RepID=A0A9W7CXR7_9STRA|nr:unnamed protein product [Phytophthora lilii]
MALTEATQEAIWLKAFLCELGEMKSDEAVKIYEDNQGSIALAKNPEFYWKVRILNTVKLDEAEGRQHSGRDRSGCWKPLEGKNEDSKVID